MEKIRTEKERTQGNSPAGSLEGNKADMTKNEAPISKTNETEQGAPKKKKIVMITNPENSRMPGRKNQAGQGSASGNTRNYSTQGGYSSTAGTSRGQQRPNKEKTQAGNRSGQQNRENRDNRETRATAAPVRPIKPLTPPSPTPSVAMVPPKPQQPRNNKDAGSERIQKAAEKAVNAVEKPVPEKITAEKTVPEKVETVKIPTAQTPIEKTASDAVKSPVSVPEEKKAPAVEERKESSQEIREQDARNNRTQDRPARSTGYRPEGGRRPDGNRTENGTRTDNRSRDNSRGNDMRDREQRPNRFEGGRRPEGANRTDGRNQENREQRGFRQDSRGDGRRQTDGFSRGGAGNGRPSSNRTDGSFRSARSGGEGASSDRRGGNGMQSGGRGFGGGSRDSRGGGQTQDRFRGQSSSAKSFAAETSGKDMEKKREEEKRRVSQEKDKRSRKDFIYEEEEPIKNKPGRFIKPEKKKEEAAEEVIKVITLPERIVIKDLAEKMRMQPAVIIKKLFLEGKIVTLNQEISYEDAEAIAMEYDILCEKEEKVDVIEELLKEDDEDESNLVERPPVVCVMGNVDHGKTSLLDAIRKTNVTDKEAGGITQHIGAYTVNVMGRKITFLDTPGHEAFTAMRMRGANSTDIAILVVAADDGVMPQTVEAINHAKAAGIEIIVAVNKIDKPSANIERVKQELTEYGLIAEDWGGSTVFAPVSAKTGEGINQLLEMILLTADILELKANPNRRARGIVVEAELDKGRGPVATVLIQKGTLHVGDFVSAGSCYGKVRAMIDDKGKRVKDAGPSTPVEILGLSDVPSAGEVILAHENDKTAKSYAETYLAQNKEKMLEETKARMSLDDLFSQIKEGNLKELNLIVKADVQGSVEAVKQSLLKLSNEEVVVKCIHGGVGAINESDVMLAGASNAIIIGFNVRPDAMAKSTAEREGVDIRLYRVIYQAIEDIEAAMKGMLDPVFEEKILGHAEVRQIFKASAVGNIAGSYVLDGVFQRGCKVRISREGKQIFEGNLASLKRFKDDVKEVKAGFECGLVFEGFDQMQELDIVEAYTMVEVPR